MAATATARAPRNLTPERLRDILVAPIPRATPAEIISMGMELQTLRIEVTRLQRNALHETAMAHGRHRDEAMKRARRYKERGADAPLDYRESVRNARFFSRCVVEVFRELRALERQKVRP